MFESKVFVGNIPFDATPVEFYNCFKDVKGFISADLINSRGFGFVTLQNNYFSNDIIKIDNFFIKNRKLRLSLYDQPKKSTPEKIFIRLMNINDIITRDEIKKEFDNFCKTGICFIDRNRETGEFLSTGIIELFDKDVTNQLLDLGSILMPDGSEIILKPYEDNNKENKNNKLLKINN